MPTVGREVERRAVAMLLSHAEAASASLVIEGEPGIGKTTLMLEAADTATTRGFQVLTAQGAPTEVRYAYSAVADLLDGVDSNVVAALPGLQRTAIDRVLSGAAGPDGGPATDEYLVATAFLSITKTMSLHAPALIAIDDGQWLDASSRAVIGFASRRLRGRVGLLVSFRTGETVPPDAQSWLDTRRMESVTRVRMQPLSLGGVHALLVDRLGRLPPRPAMVRIYEASGGNPFFALELAAGTHSSESANSASLPDSLAGIVRSRIGAIDDDVAALLLVAASANAPTVELLGASTDIETARLIALLENAEASGIIRIEGNRVRFTHPLFASGLYTAATASQRRAAHRALAAVTDQPELNARHLALAATTADPETLTALDAAADSTSSRGAPAAAAELIELALGLDRHSNYRRVRAGELHFRAGSLAAARDHLAVVLREEQPGLLRCMALMWLGAVRGYDDDIGGAIEAMSDAADQAAEYPPLRLLCLLRLALALAMADRLEDALARSGVAVEIATQLGVPDLLSQTLSIRVAGTFAAGLGVDADALQTALSLEDALGGATTWFRASAVQAMMSAYTGELETARDQLLKLQQRMLSRGTEVDIIWAAVHVSAIALWLGRYAEATAAAQDAVIRAEQLGGHLSLITAWTVQSAAAAYTGSVEEARSSAQAAIDAAHRIGAPQLAKEPTVTLGFLEVSRGDYVNALAVLQPRLDAFDPIQGTEIEGGGHLPDAIEALCSLARFDDAERLVDALESNGRVRDRPWMLATGARGRAQLLAATGDLDGAHDAAVEALQHHQRLPMPFETARTRFLLGQLQRRRRQRHSAAEIFTEVLNSFESLGAVMWAQKARAELDRLSSVPSAGASLTPAENRVARSAAAGMSNKEIAAELFISTKTVEMRLSATYRKLGIRSRAQLHTRLSSEETGGHTDSGNRQRP